MSDPREIWVAPHLKKMSTSRGTFVNPVLYIHADAHVQLTAQADALYEALADLFIGMVQHANQEGPGPTGADMLAAEAALRGYRGEGGERC